MLGFMCAFLHETSAEALECATVCTQTVGRLAALDVCLLVYREMYALGRGNYVSIFARLAGQQSSPSAATSGVCLGCN